MIEVVRPGPLTTVQDLGRPGLAALGVGRSGAADRRSAALANRLVGNLDGAAVLETTFGGLVLRFRQVARVVVTGAPCPIRRGSRGEAMNAPFTVWPGEELTLGAPTSGLRTYLAVRGGIGVDKVLESRSTDLLAGLGPAALSEGDVLPIGTDECGPLPSVEVAPVPDPAGFALTVRVMPGPRDDWFTPEALKTFSTATYEVTSESNRVGVRLTGPALERSREGELLSEGMVPGAIQVPPSGLPLVFLADHPVTGGYPVIGVVLTDDLPVMAQARPGQTVSFRLVPADLPAAA
ncbi:MULTISPECIES: biotin-dependent carboxyltransferase family protein [Amycolatopsis]|uniref:Biotin-dependent carboxyltransferase family protein n=1 Tax=Amycolatopsis thermalba TaxID=944492 RepID=A0ABY4NSM4_9PSEU|nr:MULTISPECIES: biotin-dependent carboxyltransferase family protein [Amycolatopsis]OXM61476.1 allophanate hydrolase [Amycolatopsis sp. KNN50.9b]UQS23074.1 biotin-dependent carboxyltransferase family protein [Amycolatopsis thermalba]